MEPLVSVIIPVYNTGATALALADKLLHKSTYKNVEIILVDDGSQDDSLKQLQEIKSRKVKVFAKENGGPSSARNYGIEHATGDYFLFVDSDDDVNINFVEKLLREMQKPDTAIAVTSVRYRKVALNSSESVWTDKIERRANESTKSFVLRCLLHDGRMYSAYNKIFAADIVRKHKVRFDEKVHFGEDTKFTLDYLKYAKGEIRFVLEPLYTYYFGTETSLATRGGVVWKNWALCYKNLRDWMGKKISLRDRATLLALKTKWRVGCLRMAWRAKK